MRRVFRKNQVVITTLAFLIAIAGYISYDRTHGDKAKDAATGAQNAAQTADIQERKEQYELFTKVEDTEDMEMSSTEISNPGETVLTGAAANGADYAAEIKLNREQIRSKNKEALLEIINNVDLDEAQKQSAVDEMVQMSDIAEKEAAAEMMLEAKGFTSVVVSMDSESCDVVLDMGEVTDAKRAQIEDIVKRKTGISADKIIITAIHTGENADIESLD